MTTFSSSAKSTVIRCVPFKDEPQFDIYCFEIYCKLKFALPKYRTIYDEIWILNQITLLGWQDSSGSDGLELR